MASKNGHVARQGEPIALPLRFGAPGTPVVLGEETYHLAIHTTAGARELLAYINAAELPMLAIEGSDTPGMALINAALVVNRSDVLKALLDRAVFEALPADIVERAAPGQMIACIDTLLDQAGLTWLNRILKNSLAAMSSQLQLTVNRILEQQAVDVAAKLNEIESREAARTGTASTRTASPASSS